MQNFSNITTATEVQRNYGKVAKKAKSMDDALIIFSNNKPDLVIADYRWYAHIKNTQLPKEKKIGVDAAFGAWTKEEADEFDAYVEEAFEQINPEDWK